MCDRFRTLLPIMTMPDAPAATRRAPLDALGVGVAIAGAYHVVLALYMGLDPGSFFHRLGPFGARNDHYLRDVATFYGALGVVLLVAAWRPRWRVPALAYMVVQYGLHVINHIKDVNAAHPHSKGVFDVVSLAAITAVAAWLLVLAARRE
jgi:hypothetical protein